MTEPAPRAVSVFTVFTPRVHDALLPNYSGKVPGLIGSRFYQSTDNKTPLLMSVWEQFSHFEQFRDSVAAQNCAGDIQDSNMDR